MIVLVFPGQGSQFEGMGRDLYESSAEARKMFSEADQLLGYSLSSVMFEGDAEELKQTRITQPAIFLHSIVSMHVSSQLPTFHAVAGHSLGEFSALVANQALDWKSALQLVQVRSNAMQTACEETEGTMAAVIGLDDHIVEDICKASNEVVVAANYNCPGQLVISGTIRGVESASTALQEAGAKRVLPLAVGGAFHSSLMSSAKNTLKEAIDRYHFGNPICPVYQNVNALPESNPQRIKTNLIEQLDSPVKWTQTMSQMIADGATKIVEVGGNGKVLSGMFKRLDRNIVTEPLLI